MIITLAIAAILILILSIKCYTMNKAQYKLRVKLKDEINRLDDLDSELKLTRVRYHEFSTACSRLQEQVIQLTKDKAELSNEVKWLSKFNEYASDKNGSGAKFG